MTNEAKFRTAIQGDCLDVCSQSRYTEYRHIGIDRPAQQVFRTREESAPFQMDDYNLYIGVLPRDRNRKPVDHTHVLWGDFDDRQNFLFDAMSKFEVEPSIVVDSGRGFQVYWLLVEPMPNDIARVVMKGIAKMHKGDHTHDAARVLRLPGTINRKNGAMARVIRLTNKRYSWTDFITYAEEGRDKPPKGVAYRESRINSGLHKVCDLPEWLERKVIHDPGKGQRSEHAYAVVCSLIELGWDFEDIVELFEDHPEGVGAKYHEKQRQGESWLRTTYENASRNI